MVYTTGPSSAAHVAIKKYMLIAIAIDRSTNEGILNKIVAYSQARAQAKIGTSKKSAQKSSY